MTPEALYDYLIRHRFDEDSAQTTICAYLALKSTIRYPKAWAWKVAHHARLTEDIKAQNARRPELAMAVTAPSLSPARHAEVHQELAAAFSAPPKRKRGRPPGGGLKAWQQDYQTLKNERA